MAHDGRRHRSLRGPGVSRLEPHPFDRALELEPVPAGATTSQSAYCAQLDASWWVSDVGPWGGYVAALLVKAIGETVPELPVVSLSTHFLRRLRVGDALVTVDVEARGSRVGHVSARVTQDDRAGAVAL